MYNLYSLASFPAVIRNTYFLHKHVGTVKRQLSFGIASPQMGSLPQTEAALLRQGARGREQQKKKEQKFL